MNDTLEIRDCSIGGELAHHDGRRVSIAELGDLCVERAAKTPDLDPTFDATGGVPDFHPLATTRPARWERALQLAIFATSGQVARRDELIHGREVLQHLPRSVREIIRPVDVLGVLAPLLLGFRVARGAAFVNEANRHVDAAAVLGRLLDPRPLVVEIPLCAHRERPSIAANRLARAPWAPFVRRVAALVGGMLASSRVEHAEVRFLSQGPSERAASCMFPSVFQTYATSGRLDELLGLLGEHQQILRTQLDARSTSRVRFGVGSIDPLSCAAEAELAREYGDDWQATNDVTAGPWSATTVGRDALRSAIDHVARLMPEVGRLRAASLPSPETPEHAAAAWFARRASMSLHGRALFEIAFYRQWALRARAEGAIGLGFDRDFSAFQRLAWQSAFEVEPDGAVPLVYARRTTSMRAGGALGETSFRQFWVEPSAHPRIAEVAA